MIMSSLQKNPSLQVDSSDIFLAWRPQKFHVEPKILKGESCLKTIFPLPMTMIQESISGC